MMKSTVAKPGWSDEASSQQAEHWLSPTSPSHSREEGAVNHRMLGIGSRLGNDSVAENGALGGVGVWRLRQTEGRSRQDWTGCSREGTKLLWRTARAQKGHSCALALATEAHVYNSSCCAISIVFQSPTAPIWSRIRSLPNPHCSSHFSVLMGKSNVHRELERL